MDDSVNIRLNPYLRIERLDLTALWHAASSGGTNPLGRPISKASFAVGYHFFGMSPYFFKAMNLVIHVINGLLVFVLVRVLLSLHLRVRGAADDSVASWTSIAVAAIWVLHPFNLTGVLYVVQRMTSLSAMFMLSGIALYLFGRRKLLEGSQFGLFFSATAVLIFTPLAALCKETGLLLPLLILVCEAILLRWSAPDRRCRHILMMTVGLTVVVPLVLGLVYMLNNPAVILGGYAWRDFSLGERLLTETRVIWFYLHMILLPNLGAMGLYHDDFLVSRSLLSPWTTLPALVGLVLLATLAFVVRNKQPLITFGIAFFFVGHAMESTIIPLELVFEHRNYLPILGVLIPLSYFALNVRLHPPSRRARRIAFGLLLVLFTGLTATRAHQWGDTFTMHALEVERHPESVRAQFDLAKLYDFIPPTSQQESDTLYEKARFHYQRAVDNDPSSVSGLFGILAMNARRGWPIDQASFGELEQRLATVRFGPPNTNTLIGAARDFADGHIQLPRGMIERIFRAVMSNPQLTVAIRNQIRFEFGNLPLDIRPDMTDNH